MKSSDHGAVCQRATRDWLFFFRLECSVGGLEVGDRQCSVLGRCGVSSGQEMMPPGQLAVRKIVQFLGCRLGVLTGRGGRV